MKLPIVIICLLSLLFNSLVFAETTPKFGEFDPRVRVVEYNAQDVTKVVTFFGVSSHIQFSNSEVIKDIAVGDPTAWEIIPRTNNLFIRPLADNPDANLTIITNKRTYHFSLFTAKRSKKDKTAWQDPNLTFSLVFNYKEEQEKDHALAKAKELKSRFSGAKTKLEKEFSSFSNIDYWVAGSQEISPTSVRDNGRFIYLTFSNNRDMPAIYSVDEFGKEALINTNVKGNTIIIHRMVKLLRLRKGRYVACLVNRSFDLNGGKDNSTGTVSPAVERKIKERIYE